jgi:hypothetical protein
MLFQSPKAGRQGYKGIGVQGCFLGAEGDLQGSPASISRLNPRTAERTANRAWQREHV